MKDDPIVSEVRKVRARIMAEFDYDLDKYVRHAQQKTREAKAAGRKVVARPSKGGKRAGLKRKVPGTAA